MTVKSVDAEHAGNVWDVARTEDGSIHVWDMRHDMMKTIGRYGVFAKMYRPTNEADLTAEDCLELAKSLTEVAHIIQGIQESAPQYHHKI